ncbi:MAG: 30S ribosomal protein S9 [Bacteroidia bacterium]|nr:MAG: 30S ribosomal protein S9 [Bacteroidia bacterium]
MERVNTLGRRKSAVARIYVTEGTGNILINNKVKFDDYFTVPELKYSIRRPLELLDAGTKYDIKANLSGGGIKGQAEALRLAIARAMVEINPEDKPVLKKEGYLTRDARVVERKKPGQPKARKKFQFSKR